MRDEANPTPPFEYGGRPVTFREHAQLRAEMNRKLGNAFLLIMLVAAGVFALSLAMIFKSW